MKEKKMKKQEITTGQGMDEKNPVVAVSDSDVELTAEVIKELAQKGILAKYPITGAAINFLLFGGFGIPGMIDNTVLVKEALKNNDKKLGEKFTQEMATNLVEDLAGMATTKALEKMGISIVEKLENPLLFFNILFSSETLGDGTLPPELKPDIPVSPTDKGANPDPEAKGSNEGTNNSLDDPKLQGSSGILFLSGEASSSSVDIPELQSGNEIPLPSEGIGNGSNENVTSTNTQSQEETNTGTGVVEEGEEGMELGLKDAKTGEPVGPPPTSDGKGAEKIEGSGGGHEGGGSEGGGLGGNSGSSGSGGGWGGSGGGTTGGGFGSAGGGSGGGSSDPFDHVPKAQV
jgi:hypothetical protein